MAFKRKKKSKKKTLPQEGVLPPTLPIKDKALLAHYDRAARDPGRSAEVITALLNEIARDGYPPGDVFVDFMRLAEVLIDALPRHIRSVHKTGHVDFTDPPEVAAFYEGLRARYPPDKKRWLWEKMIAAVAILVYISNVTPEGKLYYQDTIGQVYLDFVRPSEDERVITYKQALKRTKKSIPDQAAARGLINQHLATAGAKAAASNPLALAIMNTGLMGSQAAKSNSDHLWVTKFAQDNMLPALMPYYEPVRIFAPVLGSGAAILAAASMFPDWMVQLGLVQFEGADPSPLCVQMTQLNAKVYGLNGAWLEAHHALAQGEEETDPDDTLTLFQADLTPEMLDFLPDEMRSLYAKGETPPDPKELNKARRASHVTLLSNEKGDNSGVY